MDYIIISFLHLHFTLFSLIIIYAWLLAIIIISITPFASPFRHISFLIAIIIASFPPFHFSRHHLLLTFHCRSSDTPAIIYAVMHFHFLRYEPYHLHLNFFCQLRFMNWYFIAAIFYIHISPLIASHSLTLHFRHCLYSIFIDFILRYYLIIIITFIFTIRHFIFTLHYLYYWLYFQHATFTPLRFLRHCLLPFIDYFALFFERDAFIAIYASHGFISLFSLLSRHSLFTALIFFIYLRLSRAIFSRQPYVTLSAFISFHAICSLLLSSPHLFAPFLFHAIIELFLIIAISPFTAANLPLTPYHYYFTPAISRH